MNKKDSLRVLLTSPEYQSWLRINKAAVPAGTLLGECSDKNDPGILI
jgi:hypothetical protein